MQFRRVARTLVEQEKAPTWFVNLECINWHGKYKDFSFVPNTKGDRVVLIDDQKEYIKPDQKNSWVYIPGYDYPYSQNDSELEKVISKLSQIN